MRAKLDHEEVLRERAQDLKTLIYYFSVTRVIQCESYHDKIGGFSYQKFSKAKRFLFEWKGQPLWFRNEKKNLELHHKYSEPFNETLGIPHELIYDILGRYGRGERVNFKDALKEIGGERKWKVVGKGQSAYTNKETGERVVKSSWCGKIYPRDAKEWYSLIHSGTFARLETIPDASPRAIEIINAWRIADKFSDAVVDGRLKIEDFAEVLKSRGLEKSMVDRVVTWLNRMMKKEEQ